MSDELNQHRDDFDACLAKARQIVTSYRSQAPDGCDPQNSWIYVGTTVVSTGVSMYGASKSRKESAAYRDKSMKDAYARLQALSAGAGAEVFGSVPEHAPYEPIDLSQSQLDTIAGNQAALPGAASLASSTNDYILADDLKRIRALVPQYDNNINRMGDVTRDLLLGRLPYGDVLDITANRSEMSANLGIPGGGANATLRDLGLSQMGAIQQGGSMFQQMLQAAQAVNPHERRMTPQGMFFTPQQRAELDITQAQLKQQSEQSRNNLEAMPDPTAAGQFQLGLAALGLQGGGTDPGPGTAAMYQAIAGGIGAMGNAYGARQAQTGTTAQGYGYNQYTNPAYYNTNLTGGGASVGARPTSMSYYGGGTAYNWNGSSLTPANGYGSVGVRPTGYYI
jgi:hypothetical protein